MASVDDVFIELKELSAQMWRGTYPKPGGGVIPGMVPHTQHLVTAIQDQVTETRGFLQAINEQTLGRIESEIKDGSRFDAVSAASARLSEQLASVEQAVTELREGQDDLRELVTKDSDMVAKLDSVTARIESDMAKLHAKLDALTAEVQGLR